MVGIFVRAHRRMFHAGRIIGGAAMICVLAAGLRIAINESGFCWQTARFNSSHDMMAMTASVLLERSYLREEKVSEPGAL